MTEANDRKHTGRPTRHPPAARLWDARRFDTGAVATTTAEVGEAPLPESAALRIQFRFGADGLRQVRQTVGHHAGQFGLTPAAAVDYVAAVHEIAANAVVHGGGIGTLRIWSDGDRLTTEVHDPGVMNMPPSFDQPPPADQTHGRGLWLAHQLCHQLDTRSTPLTGTTVRLVCLREPDGEAGRGVDPRGEDPAGRRPSR